MLSVASAGGGSLRAVPNHGLFETEDCEGIGFAGSGVGRGDAWWALALALALVLVLAWEPWEPCEPCECSRDRRWVWV